VGVLLKLDHNTLYRLKGKFARVYINIDITKPLPRSLSITHKDGCLRVPLIYEGLHEVCPLCGGKSHLLEACPKLPITKKVEVVVEKFESSTNINAPSMPAAPQNPPSSNESWATVSPKKRVKAMISAKLRRNSMLNPERAGTRGTSTASAPLGLARALDTAPLGHDGILLANALAMQRGQPLAPEDPLDALNEGGDEEHNVDMYLNLQNLEDVEMSTDSSKRKRREEGQEASSQGPN